MMEEIQTQDVGIIINGERYLPAITVMVALADLSDRVQWDEVALEEIDRACRELGLIPPDGPDEDEQEEGEG